VEARLRAAIEAQEHSELQIAQVQDRFLDRFAHELAAMNNKVRERLARHRKLASGTGTVQKIYTKAMSSSDELAEYLDGIKQFTSTRTGSGQRPKPRKLPLESMLEKVLRQFESRKDEAGVEVVVNNHFESGKACALADPTLTGQILYNLISNAIKYSPRGSKVEITLSSGGIEGPNQKDFVSIMVRDAGPGIAPEYHERIFEKFYRVKDDYVYKVKGHGLGLYLSRFFADQMGAYITISSSPGAGASFTLILPAATLDAEEAQ
jgi:two-component system sensor histidine kinase SenX3